jgi:tetratricopeptide (TPR) repeat protein
MRRNDLSGTRLVCALALLLGSALAIGTAEASEEGRPEAAPGLADQATAKMDAKDWAGAAALWQRVVEQSPVVGNYWSNLARARYETKDYKKAIVASEKALELRAGFPWIAAYRIARCHALLGDKEEALTWLEKSFALGFRSLEDARKEGAFKSLHAEPRFRKLVALVDADKMTRTEGWRYDIELLVRELKRLHYDLSKRPAPRAFDALAQRLHDDVPSLTDHQLEVGLMELARLAGDGHTSVGAPYLMPPHRKAIPVQLYLFQEGLFITGADPDHKDLAGAQVLRIGGHSVDKVQAALDPLISRDNEMWPKFIGPRFMRYPQLLNGLGLIEPDDKVTLDLQGTDGKERQVTLKAQAGEPDASWINAYDQAPGPVPLYLKDRKAPYWFEHLSDSRAVYFQYNAVADDDKEPLDKFCQRLFDFIGKHPVDKLVIDMRFNGGGNNFLNRPIVHGLIRCDKINQRGKLFVIIGRNTFSAAQCGATNIGRETSAIFVGEPTGSSPNFVGESCPLQLPYSKMEGTISDLYWQNSVAMDYRTWIGPEIYAPPTFEAFSTKKDTALEAILAYGVKDAKRTHVK